jgi:aromatic ring-opening dioxygenase catalytic subunit (LigB family)
MKKLPSQITKPDAILVISAHWEESAATLLGANRFAPGLINCFWEYTNRNI